MKKDFLDELIDGLVELKNGKKKISLNVPPAPHEVFEVIVRVAKNHSITADELRTALSFRDVKATDRDIINDLESNEKK